MSASAIEHLTKVISEALAKNKLSQSRVETTKAAAGKCFDRPQLARKELLRLHLQAPTASKVTSLYLFDAIVRHAKDIIRKHGSGFDAASVLPTTAKAADPQAALVTAAKEFLSELTTIVEEIAINTASTVKGDQREKVPKVLDIWRKSGAFETELLDRVSAKVSKVAGPSQTKSSSGASSAHAIHKGQSGQSTTPPGSPPPYVKGKFRETTSQAGGQPSQPAAAAPLGLPSNLAALLGAQGPSADQNPDHRNTSNGASTAEFMQSLNNLVGRAPLSTNASAGQASGQAPGTSSAQSLLSSMAGSMTGNAMPSFDLTQLNALQNLAQTQGNAERQAATGPVQGTQSPPNASAGSTASKPVSSSLPKVPGLPPKPGLPGPPPGPPPSGQANSNGDSGGDDASSSNPKSTIPYPPRPDPFAGDLSTFPLMQIPSGSGDTGAGDAPSGTVVTFNPTIAWHWPELAKRWANSYGYMPSLVELAFNYLMTYQRSLMGAGGNGFPGGMPFGGVYPGGFQDGPMAVYQPGGEPSTAAGLAQGQGDGYPQADSMQAKGQGAFGASGGAGSGSTLAGTQSHQQGGGLHGLPPRPNFNAHGDGGGGDMGQGMDGTHRQTTGAALG